MPKSTVSSIPLNEFALWHKLKGRRIPFSFDLEITARCNNNCRHCYINLPVGDKVARESELTVSEITEITKDAVSLGAIWCLLTGGEPLLRDDFFDIYLSLKKMGFLISVFTNATLITDEHVRLFKKYPPRDVEVSVYGVTRATYERVTRCPGSFDAFMHGLNLLLEGGVKVRFKTMALRSNVHELSDIARFCRARTKDYYRFDPFLHLRFDHNAARNEEIKSERLSANEIVSLEKSDSERMMSLKKDCDRLIIQEPIDNISNQVFLCSVGINSFAISCDGKFRLCSSLWHPQCIYDLHKGNLIDAWSNFVIKVLDMQSDRKDFLAGCRRCPIINLCLWCPAHADLETEELDEKVDYFCDVARARAAMLKDIA